MSRWTRLSGKVLLYTCLMGGTCLSIDDYYNSHRVQRNLRALYTAARIIYEYKVNWNSSNTFKQNEAIHRRAAKLILNCCQKNGGLYIKFGQGIASMNHILPKPYREEFQVLHDKAPCVPFCEIRKIILDDLKVDPNLIFSQFDETPVASASVAQVHKAKLHSGETVAVKVQKPYIADQIYWDLTCYRIMLHGFQWAFELPLIWSTDFTERQMLTEIDFVSEAMNSQKSSQLLKHEKYIFDYPNKLQRKKCTSDRLEEDYENSYIKNNYLKNKVYVPKLYPSYCSKRILTAEWCDGVKVNDVKSIKAMGFKFSDIMHTVVSLFGYQIFVTGVVHCDPHPGNLLVRQKPGTRGRSNYELVFLDHGLYLEEPADFRKQYSQFWTAMFLGDMVTLNAIGHEWGVRDVEFFASLQLIRPFSSKKGIIDTKKLSRKDMINIHLMAKKRAQKVLSHTMTIPRHLIFVGRNMNLVRANNKDLGSTVNRVGILAEYAAKGSSLRKEKGRFYYWHYKMNIFGLAMYYQWKSLWKSVNDSIFGENSRVTSFEEDIEKQMEKFAKDIGLIVEGVDETMFDA